MLFQGGVTHITEKCFQDGHLAFVGQTKWIYKKIAESPYDEKNWEEVKAVRTKIGTWPVGSEWTKIEAPKDGPLPAWGIKDLVQVPANLISSRWHAQAASQVWSSCANMVLELPK